ncbi:hypothetical protein TRICI_001980 [Trichomonascus ciferrii]|uniref:Uncharacterized protein n=1 Tax=Trichomonascus ciferrii TaxID=44093 RepID=A0A642VC35_9ASCO|nr:hypothetical protein TRICI_001980 [Trichomonascus ciferrii]
MGFAANRIEAAARNTSGESLEEAVQWIEEHQAKFDMDEAKGLDPEEPIDIAELNDDQLAKIKKAAAHEGSSSTGSTNEPEPAPPKTEEEKAAKLAALKERAELRRKEQAKKDAEEKRKNDRLMLKKEKDYAQIVEEQQRKEAVKEAEKKKKEAKEDAAAKRRIKELIEQDKRDRQQKRQGESPQQEEPVKKPSPPANKAPPVQRTESKIRYRMPNSPQPGMLTFPLTATVADVVNKIAQDHGLDASSVQLVTTFPTQTFTVSDTKALTDAGLVNTNVMVKLA